MFIDTIKLQTLIKLIRIIKRKVPKICYHVDLYRCRIAYIVLDLKNLYLLKIKTILEMKWY